LLNDIKWSSLHAKGSWEGSCSKLSHSMTYEQNKNCQTYMTVELATLIVSDIKVLLS